ncbi:receptor-type tyrosine-protein phosphatase kappa [Plakobranchus ocellatus]|uniref:Receptor-type tyrosine-protein phosphatase kappa n=1 Tax=Plakobranchus ocellatus TaxID=259542 RepID=A0AAV4A6R8_9GAST|nr:receptor-type tyrosine-protein phosphatase kappa [Plakobranchus ocellatus]
MNFLVAPKKQQCDKYWVDHTRKYTRHGDIHIWHERSVYLAKLNIRTFRIQKSGSCESRVLTHFEMVGLHEESPDPGLLLEVRRRVNALAATQPGPVLVHCRCGGGRTAVYISVDFCLQQLQAEDRVDVYNTVMHLRRFRRGMVRTLGQYIQIYTAVAMYLQCGLTVHPALTLPAAVHVHYRLGGESKHVKLEREFQTLQSIVPRLSIGDCASGHRVENRSKSRDIMMLPPERARPYLTTADCGDSGTDFINAVYVDGYHFENAYLVTQWPMKRTVADLWRLLFDFKITSLVLMNDMRKFARKYPRFWPKEIDHVVAYGPISVRYLYCERKSNLIIRTFTIRKPKRHPHLIANALMSISDDVMILNTLVGCETRMDELVVKLFQVVGQPSGHYSSDDDHSDSHRLQKRAANARREKEKGAWPERDDQDDQERLRRRVRTSRDSGHQKEASGLDQWSESLLACMGQVSDWQKRTGSRQPVCVVSKDGSSRVGAYCAIAVCCDQVRVEREVDVFNAVRLVRKNRPQLVPNIEEYHFIYRFMADFTTQANLKPEIVISEPEVTPDCFSPLATLSPTFPVARTLSAGLNVAAPGKIFRPSSAVVTFDGQVSDRTVMTRSGNYRKGDPGTTLPQDTQNLRESELGSVSPDSGLQSFNLSDQRLSSNTDTCGCEEVNNSQLSRFGKGLVQSEVQYVEYDFSVNEADRSVKTNLCEVTGTCYSKQLLMSPMNKELQNVDSRNCREVFPESSKAVVTSGAEPTSGCCCSCVAAGACDDSSCQKNSCHVSDVFLIPIAFERHACQHSVQSCNACIQNCHCLTHHHHQHHHHHHHHSLSRSESNVFPETKTVLNSPWLSHPRSKPTTPQKKVSWPPPATLSPGQYISPPQAPVHTSHIAEPQAEPKFTPPPAPPPTPYLRLCQLSTCNSAASFYSCRSQLSVDSANPSCCPHFEISISKNLQHRDFSSCRCSSSHSVSNLINPGLCKENSTTLSTSSRHLNNSSAPNFQTSCLKEAGVNGNLQFLSSCPTSNHLNVPRDECIGSKASISYTDHQSQTHSPCFRDISIKTSRSSITKQTQSLDNHHALRQQTMRVCVPSGGDPSDFKLIHASYASLDESICSSSDSHSSLMRQANGDAHDHHPRRSTKRKSKKNNNINSYENNNHSGGHGSHSKLGDRCRAEPDNVKPLAMRRLSKNCAADVQDVIEPGEAPNNSSNKYVLQKEQAKSCKGLWKRAKRYAFSKRVE